MQLKKKKRVLAFLLAAMLALPMGTAAYAEDAEAPAAESAQEETESEESGGRISIEEAAEQPDAAPDTVKQYMKPLGELDGYAVYFREKNYKKDIEAQCLAKVGSVYAEEDEAEDAADEIIDPLKHAEVALLATAPGKVAAALGGVGGAV